MRKALIKSGHWGRPDLVFNLTKNRKEILDAYHTLAGLDPKRMTTIDYTVLGRLSKAEWTREKLKTMEKADYYIVAEDEEKHARAIIDVIKVTYPDAIIIDILVKPGKADWKKIQEETVIKVMAISEKLKLVEKSKSVSDDTLKSSSVPGAIV